MNGHTMRRLNLTITLLKQDGGCNAAGGGSEAHPDLGFRAAFFDCATGSIYLSRHRDGRIASSHLLDGLPEEVVLVRTPCGGVAAAKSTLIAGFERKGFFYTRTAMSRAVDEWSGAL